MKELSRLYVHFFVTLCLIGCSTLEFQKKDTSKKAIAYCDFESDYKPLNGKIDLYELKREKKIWFEGNNVLKNLDDQYNLSIFFEVLSEKDSGKCVRTVKIFKNGILSVSSFSETILCNKENYTNGIFSLAIKENENQWYKLNVSCKSN